MSPLLASLSCLCLIAGLFYLDRDKTFRPSKALWLPIIWIAIAGSRSISAWFSLRPGSNIDNGTSYYLDSSPADVGAFAILLIASLGVLFSRRRRIKGLLLASWPVLLYFSFCLISTSWSYEPDVSLKRWVKAIGDLAMVLVIVSDPKPMVALSRLTSRIGFVFFPLSMLFIKYFPMVGRGYTPDGIQMNTGVTTNKNMLGVILLVISLSTLWRVCALWRAKETLDRRRHLYAQMALLVLGAELFRMAHSATAIACFVLGGGIILATNLRVFRNRPSRIHALFVALIVVGGLAFLLGAQGGVAAALGRDSTLSGRKEIWAAVIPAAPNPIIGAGFEGFWISPNVEKFQRALVGWWHPEGLNEAHNGYIEVYLNLGLVGLGLIVTVLVVGYMRAAKALRINLQVGGLFLAYILVSAVYSFTEAGFRMLDPMWIFLLLGVVGSTGVAIGLFGSKLRQKPSIAAAERGKTLVERVPEPGWDAAYASRAVLSPFKSARANNHR